MEEKREGVRETEYRTPVPPKECPTARVFRGWEGREEREETKRGERRKEEMSRP